MAVFREASYLAWSAFQTLLWRGSTALDWTSSRERCSSYSWVIKTTTQPPNQWHSLSYSLAIFGNTLMDTFITIQTLLFIAMLWFWLHWSSAGLDFCSGIISLTHPFTSHRLTHPDIHPDIHPYTHPANSLHCWMARSKSRSFWLQAQFIDWFSWPMQTISKKQQKTFVSRKQNCVYVW